MKSDKQQQAAIFNKPYTKFYFLKFYFLHSCGGADTSCPASGSYAVNPILS